MSGHGFHVHGPHDHELEHAQHRREAAATAAMTTGGMINQIAMFTAIIATIGAIFGYMGGATQANAGLYKNNAAIKKTEASNQWNYFQAKSTKQSLAEMSRDLSTKEEDKANLPDQGRPLRQRKGGHQARPQTSWKPRPPSGTTRVTSKCTSTTAGHSPPPCCRSALRWPLLPC